MQKQIISLLSFSLAYGAAEMETMDPTRVSENCFYSYSKESTLRVEYFS